jgi:hypothetical protein
MGSSEVRLLSSSHTGHDTKSFRDKPASMAPAPNDNHCLPGLLLLSEVLLAHVPESFDP